MAVRPWLPGGPGERPGGGGRAAWVIRFRSTNKGALPRRFRPFSLTETIYLKAGHNTTPGRAGALFALCVIRAWPYLKRRGALVQIVHQRGNFGIGILNRLLSDSVLLLELIDLSFHRGDLTYQLDGLGVGATATAAIRGRRSSRGGSRPGLGSLACGLVNEHRRATAAVSPL